MHVVPHVCMIRLTLGLHPANERRRYFVTMSLISWTQTSNQSCMSPITFESTYELFLIKQGKSEGFDSCDQPSNFA